jgi:F-type H+-transporting ATPase subunit gamma
MSNTATSLRRKIETAGDLKSVVHAMKALAASSIGQYEKSVIALGDYYRTVELGLGVCFRSAKSATTKEKTGKSADKGGIAAIVFGSDQGLVGQFNEVLADYTLKTLAGFPGKPHVWAVGERMRARLADANIPIHCHFPVPLSVQGIGPLVGRLLAECEADHLKGACSRVYVFHNRPESKVLYTPVNQQLLPLDANWQIGLAKVPWPTKNLPEVIGNVNQTMGSLIREYLFISLFRACAESLASENASRLSAMERADHNIQKLLEDLNGEFNRMRQDAIDEELFDVISGFEAMADPSNPAGI